MPAVSFGLHVDDEAADLTQEFAAHEGERVELLLKVVVEHHHLGEAQRQKVHRVDTGQGVQHAACRIQDAR